MSDTLPDLYIVEKIVDKRSRNGKVEYRVKWENYPETQNTWEPISNLSSVGFLINEFEEQRRIKKLQKINKDNSSSFCKLIK